MKIKEKLSIIQQLSQLTQTQLAEALAVSFPTLNSWMNERSVPRAQKVPIIDALYSKYTGQNSIPDDPLQAKKGIIMNKQKKCKNVLELIMSRPDIYKQLVLSLTYNSNRIEGSTLSEMDTAAILFHNVTLKNKHLVEHLEAKNHQTALEFLFKRIKPQFQITRDFILDLHHILMNSIRDDAGCYRNHGVRIVGANVPTANYLKIPDLMDQLIVEMNTNEPDVVKQVTVIHSLFEKIHPFSDGNGRIGRLIMAAMLLKKNLPPAIVKQEKKRFYYKYLQLSQQKGEFAALEDFTCDSILHGFTVIGGMSNS